jgi:hypothetical protein
MLFLTLEYILQRKALGDRDYLLPNKSRQPRYIPSISLALCLNSALI